MSLRYLLSSTTLDDLRRTKKAESFSASRGRAAWSGVDNTNSWGSGVDLLPEMSSDSSADSSLEGSTPALVELESVLSCELSFGRRVLPHSPRAFR